MGTPNPNKPAVAAFTDRQRELFWSKVVRGASPSACWLWTGTISPEGYGMFSVSIEARHWGYRAHRVAFALSRGEIPAGLTIDHLCRVRHCVNPDHLEAVTNTVNVLRGVGLSAVNARATHCRNGHPFAGANLRIDRQTRSGYMRSFRMCKTCSSKARMARAAVLRALKRQRNEAPDGK